MKIMQIKMHHYMTDLLGGIGKDGQVSGSLQKCKGRKGEVPAGKSSTVCKSIRFATVPIFVPTPPQNGA
jgi:hypothetical protein